MNQIHKYRVWTGERMIYLADKRNETSIIFNEWGWEAINHFKGTPETLVSSWENKEAVLMQSTGLKDMAKNDMYEGDILYCHEYDSSDTGHRITQTFKNAVVGYYHGCYFYYPKGNMQQPHQELMYAYKPAIIGNIYENKDLMI